MSISEYVNSIIFIGNEEYNEMVNLFGKEATEDYLDSLLMTGSFNKKKYSWYLHNFYLKNTALGQNSLLQYLHDISSYPLLSAEEEKECGRIIQESISKIKILKEIKLPGVMSNYVLDFDIIASSLKNCDNKEYVLKLLKKAVNSTGIDNNKEEKEKLKNIEKCNFSDISLSEEELIDNLEMVIRYRKARNKLINSNLRFVVFIAKRYRSDDSCLQLSDLIQYGNIGLIKAVGKYDYKLEKRFSTYAYHWIRQFISRSLASSSGTINRTAYEDEKLNKILSVQERLKVELGRNPAPTEVAAEAGVTFANYLETMKNYSNSNTISFETPIKVPNSDGRESTLCETLVDEKDDYAKVENAIMREQIMDILNTIKEKKKQVICMRYGLKPYDRVYTLQEIGNLLGLTRERVRQIEEEVLVVLRDPEKGIVPVDKSKKR